MLIVLVIYARLVVNGGLGNWVAGILVLRGRDWVGLGGKCTILSVRRDKFMMLMTTKRFMTRKWKRRVFSIWMIKLSSWLTCRVKSRFSTLGIHIQDHKSLNLCPYLNFKNLNIIHNQQVHKVV